MVNTCDNLLWLKYKLKCQDLAHIPVHHHEVIILVVKRIHRERSLCPEIIETINIVDVHPGAVHISLRPAVTSRRHVLRNVDVQDPVIDGNCPSENITREVDPESVVIMVGLPIKGVRSPGIVAKSTRVHQNDRQVNQVPGLQRRPTLNHRHRRVRVVNQIDLMKVVNLNRWWKNVLNHSKI